MIVNTGSREEKLALLTEAGFAGAKYFNYINVYETKSSLRNFSLTYIDLMRAIEQYPEEASYADDDSISPSEPVVLTPDQKDIEKISIFNITALGEIAGKNPGQPVQHISIPNNTRIRPYILINNVRISDITLVKSYGFYNISEIDIKFDIEAYAKSSSSQSISGEQVTSFPECWIYLGFIVEDIHKNSYSVLYAIYNKRKEKEKDKDTSAPDSNNTWEFIVDSSASQGAAISPDTIHVTDPECIKYIYFNTIPYQYIIDYCKTHDGYPIHPGYFCIYVDPKCSKEFDINFNIIDENHQAHPQTLHYSPRISTLTEGTRQRVQKMDNPDVSYALLRANPKLTGNVKVVVDSNENVYLDTFKISTALSQKKYRHIKVATSGYYGQDLMNKFKSIPTYEFYKVEDKCHTLFTPAQTYKDEYYDMYRMGAKTNDDEMYSENFSIFAPICLKSYTPDFFVVFKIDKDKVGKNKAPLYDEDSFSDIEKLQYFIKYGTVVKSYDMRPESKLGSYIKNIVDRAGVVVGDLYESYDTENLNRCIGISLDKGVVTSIYESVYPEEQLNNQVALNDYYTSGFERNHLVSKNILNLEFMFDDPEAELFSINTYFGLYIKVNTSGDSYSCIGTSGNGNTFDASINTFDADVVNVRETFGDTPLIYGITTPKEFIRLNTNIYNSKEVSNYTLKPYKNIFNESVRVEDPCSVLTIKLHDLLLHGEHLRVILPSEHLIYEVIYSNFTDYDDLDEYSTTPRIFNIHHINNEEWNVYRTSVCSEAHRNNLDITDENKDDYLKNSVDCIYHAFEKVAEKSKLSVYKINDYTIGFKTSASGAIFERICAPSGFDNTQNEYILSTHDEDKIVEFYDNVYPDKMILSIPKADTSYNYLYALGFEIVNSRIAYTMQFADFSNYDNIYCTHISDKKIFDERTILLKNGNEDSAFDYKQYQEIPLYEYVQEDGSIIRKSISGIRFIPHFSKDDLYILSVDSPVLSLNNILLYSSYPLNDGICSIFNIKDFDFEVLDAEHKFSYENKIEPIGSAGEFTKNSIFNQEVETSEEDDEEDLSQYLVYHKRFADLSTDTAFKAILEANPDFIDFVESHEEGEHILPHKILLRPYYPGYEIENTSDEQYNMLVNIDFVWHKDEEEPEEEEEQLEDGNSEDETPIYDSYSFTTDTPAEYYQEPASEVKNAMDASLLASPEAIRSTSEESVYDYIDKYRAFFDSSINNGDENQLQTQLESYFTNNHKRFDISLTSPYTCKWKSIGTDSRGENLRLMFDFDDINTGKENLTNKSYFVSGSDSYSNYLGFLYNNNKYVSDIFYKKYIKNSVKDIIKEVGSIEGSYLKDAVLNENATVDELIYDGYDYTNKYSVAYISGSNTLEFISAGVKIKIKSTNDNAINLSNYIGYSAIFVSFPTINNDNSKETEFIIDETKKEIILIWYQRANTLDYGKLFSNIEESSIDIIFDSSIGPDAANNTKYKTKFEIPFTFTDYTPGYINSIELLPTSATDTKLYQSGRFSDTKNYGKDNVRLCKRAGMLIFSTLGATDGTYTKYDNLMLYGNIYSDRAIPKNYPGTPGPLEKWPYYIPEGYITIANPVLYYNNTWNYATSNVIDGIISNYKDCINGYYITDDPKYIRNSVGTFSDLTAALQNHAIYIKTAEGKKDYTNLAGIIEMTAIEPILYKKFKLTDSSVKVEGYVHSTYAEPVMKNMLDFSYRNESEVSIEQYFDIDFNGGNIFVSDVYPMTQCWINKYSDESNYCVNYVTDEDDKEITLYKPSIDVIHNKSIVSSSWKKKLYRKYVTVLDDSDLIETYDEIDGYITGYEQKNFINSRGIQLTRFENSEKVAQEFDITSWKNTSISYNKKYIRIDISDSIVYKLLNDKNYMNTWNYLKLSSNNYKINYIKNTILPLININNKTRIILRRNNILLDKFTFSQDYDESMIEVTNYKNTLKYENGKYYMYIYIEDNYTYSVKMIIDL